MKKPMKTLSTAALATLFATTAIVPVAAADTPAEAQYEIEHVVLDNEGKNYTVSLADFNEAVGENVEMKVAHVKVNGKYYTLADFNEAVGESDSLEEALKSLEESYDEVDLNVDGTFDFDEETGDWVYQDAQPEDRLNETFFYNVA